MATSTTNPLPPQIPTLNSFPPPTAAPSTSTNIALPVAALGFSSVLILLSCVAAGCCRHRQNWREQQSSANGVLPIVNSTHTRGASTDGGIVPWEPIDVDGCHRGDSNGSGKRLGVMPVIMPGDVTAHVLALEDKAELSRNSRSLSVMSVLTDDNPAERRLSMTSVMSDAERRLSMTSVMSDEDSLKKSVSIFDEVPL